MNFAFLPPSPSSLTANISSFPPSSFTATPSPLHVLSRPSTPKGRCPWPRSHRHRHQRVFLTPLCSSSDPNRETRDDESHEKQSSSNPLSVSISRRQAIQLLNGVLGFLTLGLLVKMREQFRLMSPNSILSAFGIPIFPRRSSSYSSATAASAATTDSFSTSILPSPSPERLRDARAYLDRVVSGPRISCADFPSGSDWMNSRPLALSRELKGKMVLLDFFTYCCINCQHVLPKLAALEDKYGGDGSGGVVVVGVHSAKFSAERETRNIAAAVERYGVQHPVINDSALKLWNALGISSWPTLVLLGPDANVLAIWSGERQEGDIDTILTAALDMYGSEINKMPLPAAPKTTANGNSTFATVASPLRYPGKLALSRDGTRLYVSDSANHRIVAVDTASGDIVQIFGSGDPGITDYIATDNGASQDAQFHSPQGLALYGDNALFVADTESHAVRALDLRSSSVCTVGGNGEQGFDYTGGKAGLEQPLSSPWDVEVVDDALYVAMAGTHQIWVADLSGFGFAAGDGRQGKTLTWKVFSGSGRELEKNSSFGRTAAWAQPSHLAVTPDASTLYVADSESSSIRTIDVTGEKHPTRTIAGGDGLLAENLFAFGDRSGRGSQARFQHPLAVICAAANVAEMETETKADTEEGREENGKNNYVYVADSYNHRIKIVDGSGLAREFVGTGKPGSKDGRGKDAMFWEPAGLALSNDGRRLYVADTNNFRVRVVDTKTGDVSTMAINEKGGVGGEASSGKNKVEKFQPLIGNRRRTTVITCDAVGAAATLTVELKLPEQSHFTPGTTSRFQVNRVEKQSGESGSSTWTPKNIIDSGVISQTGYTGPGKFSVELNKGADMIQIEIETVTYYCTEADNVCRSESAIFNVPLQKDSGDKATITHNIKLRKAPSVAPTPNV